MKPQQRKLSPPKTQLPLVLVRCHQVVRRVKAVVPYRLEALLAFAALGSVGAGLGSDLWQLGAVTGVTVLRALAFVTGLVALAARAVAAVTGVGLSRAEVAAVCALTGGVTGGSLRQLQGRAPLLESSEVGHPLLAQVGLTFDLCAVVVLCAQGFDNTGHEILMQRTNRAVCHYF